MLLFRVALGDCDFLEYIFESVCLFRTRLWVGVTVWSIFMSERDWVSKLVKPTDVLHIPISNSSVVFQYKQLCRVPRPTIEFFLILCHIKLYELSMKVCPGFHRVLFFLRKPTFYLKVLDINDTTKDKNITVPACETEFLKSETCILS